MEEIPAEDDDKRAYGSGGGSGPLNKQQPHLVSYPKFSPRKFARRYRLLLWLCPFHHLFPLTARQGHGNDEREKRADAELEAHAKGQSGQPP